jgi:hypothetical protein
VLAADLLHKIPQSDSRIEFITDQVFFKATQLNAVYGRSAAASDAAEVARQTRRSWRSTRSG